MLQLAHAVATLADDGTVMKPHLVKEIENPITRDLRPTVPRESGHIAVSQADIDVVKRGMINVTSNPSGTAYEVFRGAPYTVAGKTGTAQVFSLQGAKYHGGALAEHLRDHSLFIAFAPADHPQIAIATIVENGGWGASVAGPIVRRVLDYYLLQRGKPGALQAAVASAASATEVASGPVIGAIGAGDNTQPAKVAAGFKALPPPVVPPPRGASAPAASPPDAAASGGATPLTAAPGATMPTASAAAASQPGANTAANTAAAASSAASATRGRPRLPHKPRTDGASGTQALAPARETPNNGDGSSANTPARAGADD
jgi:penicillin-binding protein 2